MEAPGSLNKFSVAFHSNEPVGNNLFHVLTHCKPCVEGGMTSEVGVPV